MPLGLYQLPHAQYPDLHRSVCPWCLHHLLLCVCVCLPPQPYNSKAGGAWFPIHLFVQLLGCVAAIVSYVLAMLQWFGKNSLGFDRHLLYAPHCELGTGRRWEWRVRW